MMHPLRTKAEEKFAKMRRQEKAALQVREKADRALDEKTARLRALRLAKEAADAEAAEQASAEKAAAKKAKTPAK